MFEELEKRAQERREEDELIGRAVTLLKTHWDELSRIAELSHRHPGVLPRGLLIMGREVPGLPSAEPQGKVQVIRTGKSRRSHRGALRVFMEALARCVTENNRGSLAQVDKHLVWSVCKARLFNRQVFFSAVADAARAGFVSQTTDKKLIGLTESGWERIEVYQTLPPERTVVHGDRQENRADKEEPVAEDEEPQLPDPVQVTSFPLTEEAVLGVMPATRADMKEVLAGVGFDVSDLRQILDQLREKNGAHVIDKVWEKGPRPERPEFVSMPPSDDETAFVKMNPQFSVAESLNPSEARILLKLKHSPWDQEDLMGKLGMDKHRFGKACGSLRAKKLAVSMGHNLIKLTKLGMEALPFIEAQASADVIMKKPSGVL